MVTDYHLNRENQRQLAEGVFRQDEDYRLTTFKQWLQAFEWDSRREHAEQDAAGHSEDDADRAEDGPDPWAEHWSARWAGTTDSGATTVLARRSGDHDAKTAGTGDQVEGVDEVAGGVAHEVERAEQLRRWHADDHPADATEARAAGADTADGSSAESVESFR